MNLPPNLPHRYLPLLARHSDTQQTTTQQHFTSDNILQKETKEEESFYSDINVFSPEQGQQHQSDLHSVR